nr:piggyBac transposable element-derived protein 3-like [Rhipicephalus microplus]
MTIALHQTLSYARRAAPTTPPSRIRALPTPKPVMDLTLRRIQTALGVREKSRSKSRSKSRRKSKTCSKSRTRFKSRTRSQSLTCSQSRTCLKSRSCFCEESRRPLKTRAPFLSTRQPYKKALTSKPVGKEVHAFSEQQRAPERKATKVAHREKADPSALKHHTGMWFRAHLGQVSCCPSNLNVIAMMQRTHLPTTLPQGEDGGDRSPLKEIRVEDNVPKNFQWKKKVYGPSSDIDFSGHNECPPEAVETCTPYTHFLRYGPESIFRVIAEHTNQYSVKTTLHNVNTTATEMRKLFGMHILMGVVHLPRVRLYWNPMIKVPLISKTMTEKRFFKLRNNLHIVLEDSGLDRKDRLWKGRPFLRLIRKRCLKLPLEQECSLDEQMTPFKGQLSIKQYVKGKPSLWGIKVFALCGSSGLLYDFAIYQGENTIPADLKKEYGLCSGVVFHLSKRISYGCNYQLYFDNYFTSVPLLRQLREHRILAAGTVRKNRLGKCPLESKKVMNKKLREYSAEYVTSDDVVVVIWKDNNDVSVASNFVGICNEEDVRRWDKTKREHILVKQPEVIAKYNRSMGSVDKMDFLLSLYRTNIRSKNGR